MQFLDWTFYHNPVHLWLTALAVTALGVVLLRLARDTIKRRLQKLAERTETQLDDLIHTLVSRTRLPFLMVVSAYLASQLLELPVWLQERADQVILVVVLLQAAVWVSSVATYLVNSYVRAELEDETRQVASATALSFIANLLIWSLILLLALENLGMEVTALVTSLGIGGIAVALALQNILGDLFASLSILLDKPFVVGDFIIVGDLLGTVERIGLKTTRVRSLHGEQLIFSNADLLNSRIRNFKRMYERRVLFGFGVIYQTPYQKLERIPSMVREIIEREELVRFDRAHFKEYGDSSLNFEVVYWVRNPDYNTYMDIQQRINLELFRRFEEEGIDFAYPTRTLYFANPPVELSRPEEKARKYA